MNKFYNANKQPAIRGSVQMTPLQDEFSGNKHSLGSILGNSLFHPETFLGSATVSIHQINAEEIMITIFNVTSLTSGDYEKHSLHNTYPMSVVRDNLLPEGDYKRRYGNISQTYSFTLPIDYERLKK